jgi:hypothetical protein
MIIHRHLSCRDAMLASRDLTTGFLSKKAFETLNSNAFLVVYFKMTPFRRKHCVSTSKTHTKNNSFNHHSLNSGRLTFTS